MTSFSPGVSHPVALVPLTEENEDAMDNKTFQKLLRTVGIRAPADGQVELSFRSFHIGIKGIIWRCSTLCYYLIQCVIHQESFWRISSSLSVNQLRSLAASLDLVEETAAEGDSEGNKESSLTVEMEDDNQDMRAQALRALLLSRQRKYASSNSKGKHATFLVMPMLIILLEAKHWKCKCNYLLVCSLSSFTLQVCGNPIEDDRTQIEVNWSVHNSKSSSASKDFFPFQFLSSCQVECTNMVSISTI